MHFIDTHTHLFSDAFNNDRTHVVENAISLGIEKMLLPNIDCASIAPMYTLCEQFPANCFPMMGLHPGSVKEDWQEQLAIVNENLFARKHYAVGEIGMDLYWDKTFMREQQDAFCQQVEWAKLLKLPIVIHAREAFNEIFELLDVLNDEHLTGVFHCFTGTLEQAAKIASYGGFMLGIGGVLTYKKSGLDEVLRALPVENFILETDSPYLPPTPHRGKRNESAYLIYIAEKLAEIKKCTLEEIAQITTANAQQLFGL